MKKLLIPLLFAGLAVSCSGDALTSLEEVTPNFGMAGNSGCYTVKFTSHSEGRFPIFNGTQTGDLGGTHVVTFEFPPTTEPTGRTWNFLGVVDWTIVGGALGGLQFATSLESRNVFNDPDPEVFAKIANLKARAISGVQKANLTGRGQTGFPDPFPTGPQAVDATWNGVICP